MIHCGFSELSQSMAQMCVAVCPLRLEQRGQEIKGPPVASMDEAYHRGAPELQGFSALCKLFANKGGTVNLDLYQVESRSALHEHFVCCRGPDENLKNLVNPRNIS